MVGFEIMFIKNKFVSFIKLSKIPPKKLCFEYVFSKNPASLLKIYSVDLPTYFNLAIYSSVLVTKHPFFFSESRLYTQLT